MNNFFRPTSITGHSYHKKPAYKDMYTQTENTVIKITPTVDARADISCDTQIVQMLRGRIVQINDKSMKIATQGNFGTLISN